VLSPDLQVEWFWDAFDHLNVTRSALLGETCTYGSGGCAVFRLAPVANDWLHGNAVQLTPDGHLLYSARHQDWLLKIDYANGAGSGGIIWRLGPDGDFQIVSDDPSPWFSHQHDANYERGVNSHRIIVHDNGNTRWTQDHDIHSRGQVFEINEENRIATLVFNVDLGDYSRALGTAEKLPNGNYHFGLGWTSKNFSQSLEFDPMGNLVTKVEVETQMYRGFRMRSLYNH
jgi:arylsulfate sulfotransferase